MKPVRPLFATPVLLTLSSAFAFAQAQPDKVTLSSRNPCFMLSDEKTFADAEKEVTGSPVTFNSGFRAKEPQIQGVSRMDDGVPSYGIDFYRAVNQPSLVPGFLVRITFTVSDGISEGQKVTRYLVTKAAINTFKQSDGRTPLTSPYFYFERFGDSNSPQVAEVTVLTLSQNGVRTKYVGKVSY